MIGNGALVLSRLVIDVATFLWGFSLALTVYFWNYDVFNPGFKCRYQGIKHWWFLLIGGLYLTFLVAAQFALEHPMSFMILLAAVYLMKTLWHRTHQPRIRKKSYRLLNQVAIMTDAVVGVIFGIYTFISANFVHEQDYQFFNICLCFVIIGTIIALETQYQLTHKIIEKNVL
jgi:hypothetical protein